MQTSEEEIYLKAFEPAAKQTLFASSEKLENIAFPFWQKAVHNVLILKGCQCVHGGKCFLDLDKEKQIGLHSDGDFNFQKILEVLAETRNLFLAETMSVSAHA